MSKKNQKKVSFWEKNKVSIIGFGVLAVIILGIFGVYGIVNLIDANKKKIPVDKKTVATLKYVEVPEEVEGMGTLPPTIDETKTYNVDNLMFAYFYSTLKTEKEMEMAQSGTEVNRYYWAEQTVTDETSGQQVNARDWLIDSTINQCAQVVLLEELVQNSGFQLSKEEEEKAIADLNEQLEAAFGTSLKDKYGDNWTKTDEWKEERNKLVVNTAYLTYEGLEEVTVRLQAISKYLEGNPEDPTVTDKDVRDYYDKNLESEFTSHKVQHILLKNTDEMGNELSKKKLKEQKKLAQQIADQINNGADMNELMKKYTGDVDAEGNPNNDGIYEVIEAEAKYDAAFTKYALNHKVGDKVGVVKGAYGYHVMKVLEVKETPFDDVKKTLKQNMISNAVMARAELLTAELDEGALVPYYSKLADY